MASSKNTDDVKLDKKGRPIKTGKWTRRGFITACEEMDVAFDDLDIVEAPAEKEYANFVLAREFVAGGLSVPPMLQDTINGVFLAATKAMGLQITGGSASVRFTGASAIQTAGAAAAWTHLCPA